jgi:hypothetical protein
MSEGKKGAVGNVTTESGQQRYSRWFTEWPSTHVNAGKTVEVMPVSEHERLMSADPEDETG